MKKWRVFLVLILSIAFWSFKQNDDSNVKPRFSATIDGKLFQLNENQVLRGILMNKAASLDGKRPKRTVIGTIFNGPSYDTDGGKLFTENILFEIIYEDGKLGESSEYTVGLQYQAESYYMLIDSSKLTITDFSWEPDKKHFRLSADFDIKMRNWSYDKNKKKDLALKGSLSNIRITVPSWLLTQN